MQIVPSSQLRPVTWLNSDVFAVTTVRPRRSAWPALREYMRSARWASKKGIGCLRRGKSTTLRVILRLDAPDEGTALFTEGHMASRGDALIRGELCDMSSVSPAPSSACCPASPRQQGSWHCSR